MPHENEQESDVEGHAFKFKFRDEQGNEHALEGDRIVKLGWRGPDGSEHEVEGHALRAKILDQESDVEGHAVRPKFRDDQGDEHEASEPFRVTYLNDSGQEQEVEGHAVRYSDLRLKRQIEPLRNALACLHQVAVESR
jgi:hypothetical protein